MAKMDPDSDVKAFEAELLAANEAVAPPGAGISLVNEAVKDNLDGEGWGTPF